MPVGSGTDVSGRAEGTPVSGEILDLCGKVCPYPVVLIVQEVDDLQPGETLRCVVDDPLALKAVPEELEEYSDVSIQVNKRTTDWEIIVRRNSDTPSPQDAPKDASPDAPAAGD